MYKLILSNEAQQVFTTAQAPLARKLAKCFARLEIDPRAGNNIKPLKGSLAGSFRYRIGDHRVVYKIDDTKRLIWVITIAHRRGVYD